MIETLEIANPDKTFIKVIGVGGGGGNAVSYMYKAGVEGVDFILMNTDKAALKRSVVPKRILLGKKGLGAGSDPRIGRAAMLNVEENVRQLLSEDTEMVFVTATLGGGTGTGGAPVVARVAKELGILTIGVVTTPFSYEGPIRKAIAEEGVREMRKYVDSLVIISNDRLSSKDRNPLAGPMKLSSSFAASDSILATAAQCISDMVTQSGYVNVDMNDVRTVMTNSGDAVIGSSEASGEYRAMQAMREALTSPLLVNNDIRNAKSILVNYLYSDKEVTIDELSETMEMVQMKVDDDVTIIWGASQVEGMGDKLKISVVVTGQLLAEDKLVGAVPDVSVQQRNIPVQMAKPQIKEEAKPQPVVVAMSGDGALEQQVEMPQVEDKPKFTPTETHDTTVTKKKLVAAVFGEEQIDETPAFNRTRTAVAERKPEPTSTFTVKLDGEEIKMGDNSYLSNRPD
ncbi:MAG: cell division protein FtsZ [Paludibacteraceae bacterium]|nr:cell division protein FtsZ [Paludibacteraceae bacterium]